MKTIKKVFTKLGYISLLLTFALFTSNVLAEGVNITGFDTVYGMFAGLLQKLSGGVVFIGAVYFGFSIYKDNPDGKVNATRIMATGAFLFSVATGWKTFIH